MDIRPASKLNIVIVGAGPSTAYLLNKLVDINHVHLNIIILEARDVAVEGAPFSDEGAYPALLSNLQEGEIPHCSAVNWSLAPSELLPRGSKQVVPRRQIGKYFNTVFRRAIETLKANGHQVELSQNALVNRIEYRKSHSLVFTTDGREFVADKLILNVGSTFNKREVRKNVFFVYPTYAYAHFGSRYFRILGCSLSAIDAALAIARNHGSFERRNGKLTYTSSQQFEIELISPSATFPQVSYTTINKKAYINYLRNLSITIQGTSLAKIRWCFLHLLQRFDHCTYLQVRNMELKSIIAYLLGRRSQVNPFQKLKIDLYAAAHCKSNQSEWPAMLESALLFAEQFIDHANNAIAEIDGLDRLIRASMASIPKESAEKLIALDAAGIIKVARSNKFSHLSSTFRKGNNDETVIDARGYVNAREGLDNLSKIIGPHATTALKEQGGHSPLTVTVTENQVLVVAGEKTNIFIGSGYLTPLLLRLPGLDVCKELAEIIYTSIRNDICIDKEAV